MVCIVAGSNEMKMTRLYIKNFREEDKNEEIKYDFIDGVCDRNL